MWQAVSHDEERATWNHRQKRRKVVARTYERARWKREDFTHQQSRRIVNAFDVIALEDLSVMTMVQKVQKVQKVQDGRLAKSIHDAAWSQFAAVIACKAGWADRRYVAVNPAHTSQDCSGCGHRKVDLTLADRVYRCVSCGLVIDRDLNASRNILAVGRHCLGLAPEKPLRLRMGSRHVVCWIKCKRAVIASGKPRRADRSSQRGAIGTGRSGPARRHLDDRA